MRIGIDLGGTKTEGILMADDGTINETIREPTRVDCGYNGILEQIQRIVSMLEVRAGRQCHVGIGTPGAISARTGELRNSNTTCLNGVSFAEDLSRRLGRPVRVENDANCFALSEAIDGSGADFAVVFGIILGTGVGGGIVVNGGLVPGRHRIAGEWGHNVLMEDGPACYCGRRGCVETLLSGPGLVAHYCAKIRDSGCDARSVFLSSAGGDPTAHRVVERYLDHFGRAVAGVVNILDPDVIVLGGGLSNAGVLYERGPDFVERYVFSDYFDTPILPGRFGDSSGVRGAARLWPPD